jgi:hypothetical protein
MKNLRTLSLFAVLAAALTASLGAGAASGTTLEVGGVKQNQAVTFLMSLEPGSSMLIKDSIGATTDTCTESTIHGTTTTPFTVSGKNEIDANISLTYGKCTHTTTVLKNGKMFFAWDGGTNATVTESEAEVTIVSTVFGASAVCKTGTGTDIGTLTGVASGHATLDFNAQVNCGILGTSTWTASYTVTTPTGLGVVE